MRKRKKEWEREKEWVCVCVWERERECPIELFFLTAGIKFWILLSREICKNSRNIVIDKIQKTFPIKKVIQLLENCQNLALSHHSILEY